MLSSSFYFRYYLAFFTIIFFIIIICIPVFQSQDIDVSNIANLPLYSVSREFAWPLPGFSKISSAYGERISPTQGASSFHYGIDIPAPAGSSFISSINGEVIYADFNRCKWFYN